MTRFYNSLCRFYRQLRGLFPSKLPIGMTEYSEWVDSIMSTYYLPTNDKDSVIFAISHDIMRFPPLTTTKAKYYFVLMLRGAAAKQIAGAAFHEVKIRSDERRAELERLAKEKSSSAPVESQQAAGGPEEIPKATS